MLCLVCTGNAAYRTGGPCRVCEARSAWESLPPEDQQAIVTAAGRSMFCGVTAMRALTPPIRLPHSVDVLAYLSRSGELVPA